MLTDPTSLEASCLPGAHKLAAERIAEQVHRWSAAHETLHCWLMLDPARSDGREELTAIDAKSFESAVKVPLHYARFPERLWPVVLQIDLTRNASATLFERAIEMAIEDIQPVSLARKNAIRVPAWTWSSQSGAQIARHIATQCRQRRGADLHFLRYFDPRVMGALLSCLSLEQQSALLWPFVEWQYVGRDGQWCRHGNGRSDSSSEHEAHQSRFQMTAEQWSTCDAIDAMNVAIADAGVTRAIDVTTGRLTQVLQSLRTAQSRGLTRDDLIDLCRMLLLVGLHVPDHPAMQPVWAAVALGASWEDALGKLEPLAWERVMAVRVA